MVRTFARPKTAAALGVVLVAVVIGCRGPDGGERTSLRERLTGPRERTKAQLKASVGWLDTEAQDAGRSPFRSEEMLEFAQQARQARKPAVSPPRKNILILSGGGSYGAYPAGVLAGWSATGTRPEFDVVTGISTGALLGAFAFLGPSEDCAMQHAYTTIRDRDIYHRNRIIAALLSESLADTRPFAKLIAETATEDRIRRIGIEHQKGRRFYVGTTDLDARRGITWDMGAIAARNTPQDRELFRKILLASAAIPGFFPPVRIPVTVDGRRYVERHIDGGTSSSMIFAPPWVAPALRDKLPPGWLYGSNMYILVAGKLYADPVPVKPRTLAIASNAVSTIVYDQTRSDLHKLFLRSILTGMNYNLSVIPKDLDSPLASTEFDPKGMTRLFNAGAQWAMSGPKWRHDPPGYEAGEGARFRAGIKLTDAGPNWHGGGQQGGGQLGPDVSPYPPVIPMK